MIANRQPPADQVVSDDELLKADSCGRQNADAIERHNEQLLALSENSRREHVHAPTDQLNLLRRSILREDLAIELGRNQHG